MKIKHNKTRNVGILFEAMANEIVRLTILNDPNIEKILKEFRECLQKNPIILKEYQIYKNISSTKCLNEQQAYRTIDTIYNSAKFIDNKKLNEAINNLYKKISQYTPIKQIFDVKVPNYKLYASVQCLINEARFPSGVDFMNHKNIIEGTIVKHLLNEGAQKNESVINEDYKVDSLTYNIMVKKFNKKYSDINEGQKKFIKEYIYFINDGPKFSNIVKENCQNIIKEINENAKSEDKAFNTKIRLLKKKIEGISKQTKNISSNTNIELIIECYDFLSKLKQWKIS